jgi:hypothetical protein
MKTDRRRRRRSQGIQNQNCRVCSTRKRFLPKDRLAPGLCGSRLWDRDKAYDSNLESNLTLVTVLAAWPLRELLISFSLHCRLSPSCS